MINIELTPTEKIVQKHVTGLYLEEKKGFGIVSLLDAIRAAFSGSGNYYHQFKDVNMLVIKMSRLISSILKAGTDTPISWDKEVAINHAFLLKEFVKCLKLAVNEIMAAKHIKPEEITLIGDYPLPREVMNEAIGA